MLLLSKNFELNQMKHTRVQEGTRLDSPTFRSGSLILDIKDAYCMKKIKNPIDQQQDQFGDFTASRAEQPAETDCVPARLTSGAGENGIFDSLGFHRHTHTQGDVREEGGPWSCGESRDVTLLVPRRTRHCTSGSLGGFMTPSHQQKAHRRLLAGCVSSWTSGGFKCALRCGGAGCR